MKKADQLGIYSQRNDTAVNAMDFLFVLHIPQLELRKSATQPVYESL